MNNRPESCVRHKLRRKQGRYRRALLLLCVASLAFVASGCDRGHVDSATITQLPDGTFQVRVIGWAASPSGGPAEVTLVLREYIGITTKSLGTTTQSRSDVLEQGLAVDESSGFDGTINVDHHPLCGRLLVVTKSRESTSIMETDMTDMVQWESGQARPSCLKERP